MAGVPLTDLQQKWLELQAEVSRKGSKAGRKADREGRRHAREARSDAVTVTASLPLTCGNALEVWFRRLVRQVVVLDVVGSSPIAHLCMSLGRRASRGRCRRRFTTLGGAADTGVVAVIQRPVHAAVHAPASYSPDAPPRRATSASFAR